MSSPPFVLRDSRVSACENHPMREKETLGGEREIFLSPHCISPFSCRVIFMCACVLFALLFLGKNGGPHSLTPTGARA